MIQKKLLSGIFWVLLANLLVKPLWILGIEVGVQNAVGAEMYGFYIGIFNLAYIFNILLDLGITNFNTRNIAQSPKLIGKHLPAILSIKLLLLLFYIVVTFTVGLLLGYDTAQFKLLAWLSLNQFLNSFILYLRSNFEGLLLFKWASLLSVLDRVLMILICGTLLWGIHHSPFTIHCAARFPRAGITIHHSPFTIYHFVYAQSAAYIVTAAVALLVLSRKTGLRRIRWNKPFTIAILKRSLPFALLVLLMASYNRLDPIMLQKLSPAGMGNYNSGIYAGAFRLLDALTMIAYIVSVPLLPIFSKLTLKQSPCRAVSPPGQKTVCRAVSPPGQKTVCRAVSPPRQKTVCRAVSPPGQKTVCRAVSPPGHQAIKDTTRLVFSLMMVFSVTAACLLAAVGTDLMRLFYNDNIEEYAVTFRILIFGIIPISATYVFGTLLTAGGYLKKLNILAAVSLLANFVVNVACIPVYGVIGSAFAALAAQSFMAVSQIVVALKIFKISVSYKYILKLLYFSLIIIAISFSAPLLPWWLFVAIAGIIALAASILLKLIDLQEIMKILKNQ